ncbi:uncharacterized protein T551_03402, partial [Pneumocystis jirovecii RU7]
METQTQPHTTAQPTPVRHGLARAVARAVKRQAAGAQNSFDEEHVLALILNKDLEKTKCIEKLKKYCQELNEVNLKIEQVHEKLKDFCDNGKADTKCQSLQTKVMGKCTDFKTKKLEPALKDPSDDNCKENERQCLFLEGACPNELKEKCSELRNKCYQRKRDGVAEEVLLRALHGDLENTTECEKKIKNVCPKIGQESDELTMLCLDQQATCVSLVAKGKSKCSVLKQKVEEALKEKNELRGKCLPLLEQCYFHRGNCKKDASQCKPQNKDCEDYLPKCDELAKECGKKGVIYIHPGPDFDPTKPEPTVAEDIGLEELYKRAEEDGVFIGRQQVRDATALLALLVKKDNTGNNDIGKKCNEILENKCKNSHEHEALEKLCAKNAANNIGKEKCKELEEDIKKTCNIFASKLINNHLFDPKKGNNGIIGWGGLPTFLSNEDCTKLESYCFYFEKKCQDGEKSCANVRAACYKRGLDARANKVLQENMRGMLHGSNKSWLEKFQQELVKVCKELKENKENFPNDELFALCVQPAKAARLLTHDLRMKTIFLRQQLDKRRDFPTDKDCKELGRKCQDLGEDSKEITWPCHTLEQQCNRLGTTEILKQVLLDEHKDTLKDQESCVKYLKEKCNKWSRRGDDRFSFICVFQNATCKSMVDDVQDR